MPESDSKANPGVKVSDRRRFDADGNPRPDAATAEVQGPAAAAQPEGPAENAQDVAVGDEATGEAQAAAEVPAPDPERQRLESELEAARRRVDELARAYQALSKDRDDFKQRLTRERDRMLDVERGNVALVVLEAVDELDRCLAASAEDTSPLAQGVRLIRESLLKNLQASGIERLQVVGQPFDPNVAEATDMELTASADDDQKVVAEVRAGYRLKERVIRPARVKVAKYIPPAQA